MTMTRKEALQLYGHMMGLHAQHHENLALVQKTFNKRCDMFHEAMACMITLLSATWSENHEELQELRAILEDPGIRDEERRSDSLFQHQFEQFTGMLADFKAKIEAMPDE
jgi:hypothetical protein